MFIDKTNYQLSDDYRYPDNIDTIWSDIRLLSICTLSLTADKWSLSAVLVR